MVRIAQFVHATNDVVDEDFLREFPEVEAVKANNLEALSDALAGAEIFHVYNSAFTPEFAKLVRDKGRALKWIQFTTVGIDVALRVGLPDGVWVTNSGDVSQRVLAGHAIALMLGVMRGFRRFEPLRARHDYARQTLPRYMVAPDGARIVILGMGRIGQDIARKAKAFDMEVICVTRAPAPAVPEIQLTAVERREGISHTKERRGDVWRRACGQQRAELHGNRLQVHRCISVEEAHDSDVAHDLLKDTRAEVVSCAMDHGELAQDPLDLHRHRILDDG